MGDKWIISKERPFDSASHIQVTKKGEATLIVHEEFLKYVQEEVTDAGEARSLLKSLADQRIERLAVDRDKKHAFYGDPDGFDRYCRVKYKNLCDHIIRMIDRLVAKRGL